MVARRREGLTSSTSVSGTVGGTAFSALDAVGLVMAPVTCPSFSGASLAGVTVVLTNLAGTCTAAGSPCAEKPNLQGLVITVFNVALFGTAQAIQPGTYQLSGTPTLGGTFGFAALSRTDASCNDVTTVPQVQSGSITITSVASGTVKGSVDLTFADSSKLAGTFTAPSCAALGAIDVCSASSGSVTPTCTGTRTCRP